MGIITRTLGFDFFIFGFCLCVRSEKMRIVVEEGAQDAPSKNILLASTPPPSTYLNFRSIYAHVVLHN